VITPQNAHDTKSVLRKEIRLKMAHKSCKSQIAVLERNGQSCVWDIQCRKILSPRNWGQRSI